MLQSYCITEHVFCTTQPPGEVYLNKLYQRSLIKDQPVLILQVVRPHFSDQTINQLKNGGSKFLCLVLLALRYITFTFKTLWWSLGQHCQKMVLETTRLDGNFYLFSFFLAICDNFI